VALKDKINDDLKAALMSGNRFTAEVLRGLKAVILNEEVAQGKRDDGVDDETIEKLIAREVKKRNESAILYVQAGREELAENEKAEAEAMSVYLPKQLTDEQVSVVVRRVISDSGANGLADMGKTIGAVKSELGNTADGSVIARLVKQELSEG